MTGSARLVPATAPGYRTFVASVARTRRLGPSFLRLTLAGDQLREFGPSGDDQRIKLLLPRPGRGIGDVPTGTDWYGGWRAMPDDRRPAMRTYTVRAFRPDDGELDVDVVLHGVGGGNAGPAATWAAAARPGDPVALVGPDRPGRGRAWGSEWAPPAAARSLLLAGDETAVPAVAAILEAVEPGVRATACLEVPHPDDWQDWRVPAGVEVRWSARSAHPGAAHGDLLTRSVRQAVAADPAWGGGVPAPAPEDVDVDSEDLWEVPEEGGPAGPTVAAYAWLAGEAGVIKGLRRHLVSDLGMPRAAVAFMGYWRLGRSETA